MNDEEQDAINQAIVKNIVIVLLTISIISLIF